MHLSPACYSINSLLVRSLHFLRISYYVLPVQQSCCVFFLAPVGGGGVYLYMVGTVCSLLHRFNPAFAACLFLHVCISVELNIFYLAVTGLSGFPCWWGGGGGLSSSCVIFFMNFPLVRSPQFLRISMLL